jgi:hypothetical protein
MTGKKNLSEASARGLATRQRRRRNADNSDVGIGKFLRMIVGCLIRCQIYSAVGLRGKVIKLRERRGGRGAVLMSRRKVSLPATAIDSQEE